MDEHYRVGERYAGPGQPAGPAESPVMARGTRDRCPCTPTRTARRRPTLLAAGADGWLGCSQQQGLRWALRSSQTVMVQGNQQTPQGIALVCQVRMVIRSPGRPKMLRISAGSSPALPNQCGTVVSNEATSPGPSILEPGHRALRDSSRRRHVDQGHAALGADSLQPVPAAGAGSAAAIALNSDLVDDDVRAAVSVFDLGSLPRATTNSHSLESA